MNRARVLNALGWVALPAISAVAVGCALGAAGAAPPHASAESSVLPSTPAPAASAIALPPAEPTAIRLEFSEILAEGPGPLHLSDRVTRANGQRVRIAGFMAEMELPLATGFYLTRTPVSCDEGGGGLGDLPPDAIRVVSRALGSPSSVPSVAPHVAGPVEVVGILDVGPQEEPDGTVSRIRIYVGQERGSNKT